MEKERATRRNVGKGGEFLLALFPIDWPEPFGLVMIESLACGTPVIAYRHGAVPEIMENSVTGFAVASQDEALTAAAAARPSSAASQPATWLRAT